MSEEREPIRLRDDPAQDAGLREMLDAARGEIASDAMLDRVLGEIVAGGGGGGSSGGSAATAKIAAAIGATAISVAVIALVATRTPPAHEVTPIAAIDAFVLTDDAYVAPDGGPPDAGTDAFVVVARVVPRPPPPPSPPPPPPPPTVAESDGALLLRATREHDASAQLALALEHRALFPTSASGEDREALIVIDLARLHRTAEANEAANAFRSRWPRSAHRTRIDTELARSNP